MRIPLILCAIVLLGAGCRTTTTAFDQRLCFLLDEDPDGAMIILDPSATPATITVTDPIGGNNITAVGDFDGSKIALRDVTTANEYGTVTTNHQGAFWEITGDKITAHSNSITDGLTGTQTTCPRE